MNKITITIDNEQLLTEFDGKIDFNDLVAVLFSIIQESTERFMAQFDQLEDPKAAKERLYDLFDGLFYRFMEDTFPDVQPRDFDLSDAAVLYAQDQIIKRAEKKGCTYEEALKWYEDKAKQHILESGGRVS